MTMIERTTRADGHPVVIVRRPAYFARLHYRLRARLPLWVVYRPTTREYPGMWVARMHVTRPATKPTRFVMAHDTLEGLRSVLPPGLVNFGRDPRDAPEIVEAWM
jgi:hypothetical protein